MRCLYLETCGCKLTHLLNKSLKKELIVGIKKKSTEFRTSALNV